MRDILTGLAALVAIALLALMVGPYFVDWDTQRARVVGLLRDHAGIEARINGRLNVSLLPFPELDAEGIEFGPAAAPILKADRITFALSPTALLRGRIVLTSARADRPELALPALRAALGADEAAGLAGLAKIGIERLDLKAARLVDPGGEAPLPGTFDLQLEAPSLLGPFRADIRELPGGRVFRLQIGRLEDGRGRMKGVIEDGRFATRVALDGWFGLPGVAGRPVFDGAATFSGNPLVGAAGGVHLPFQGGARVILHTDQAIADPVNITLGSGETALQLSGQGFVDLKPARPVVQAKLAAKRLDFAAFSGSLWALAGRGGTPPAFDLALDLALEAVQVPGATIRNVDLRLGAAGEGLRLDSLSALLPGATTLQFGRKAGLPGPPVNGRLKIESGDLQAFVGWLRGLEGLGNLPARGALSADLSGSLQSLKIEALAIRSAAGDLAGSGILEGPQAGVRMLPKLGLDLAAERFDAAVLAALDPLRPFPGLQIATRLDVRRLVLEGQELGGLSVALDRDGDTARLRALRLTGRSGEELALSGTSVGDTLNFTAKLDAEKLGDIAKLSAALFPGAATAGFLRRAAQLEPAIAVGNFRVTSRAGEATWDIVLDGKLGGTSVAIKSSSAIRGEAIDVDLDGALANPDGGRLAGQLTGIAAPASDIPGKLSIKARGNPRRSVNGRITGRLAGIDLDFDGTLNLFRARTTEGSFKLASPDLSLLSKALGGGTPSLAPGLSGTMQGRFFTDRGVLTLTGFEAMIGPEAIRGEIAFDLPRGGQVAGQIRMGAIDLATLLAPAIGTRPLLAGEAWSSLPFARAQPPLLAGDLWIEAQSLRIGEGMNLSAPQFILRFAPGAVSLSGFESRIGDGRIAGSLSLVRKEEQGSGEKGRGEQGRGEQGKAGIELGGLLRFARLPVPGPGGRMSGEIPFSAGGTSPLALISSLSGAGRIILDDVVLSEADPAALFRITAQPLERLEPINENTIGGWIARDMRTGALRLPNAERPLSLLSGQVRISGVPADHAKKYPGGVEVTPSVSVDLVRRAWEAKYAFRQLELPRGWRGAVPELSLSLTARLDATTPPRRTLQVASLVNGFLAMAIQRDLERAEAFEADLREREAQLRRQKGDAFMARREQEIRDVEEAIATEMAALQRRAAHAAELARQRNLAEALEKERQEKARAEREAAELAARTRALIEAERLRGAEGTTPRPGAPLDLAPKAVPPPAPVPPAPALGRFQ